MPLPKGLSFEKPDLSKLQQISYAINVVDQVTGRIGTFAYSEHMYEVAGSHWAISPIMDYPEDLYTWARVNGFTVYSDDEMFTIKRGAA